jgi:NAD(P)-dependent dehydrogenase (short-subunit alcohol dehydrogenase family)
VTDSLLPSFRLDGKTAIVTGASSGIGARFARVLHEAGANVVACARRLDRLEDLAKEVDGLVPIQCDVAEDDQCAALVAATIERFGTVDVLVNNAGTVAIQPAEEEPVETFRRVVDVNLTSVFLLSQLAGRKMLEQGSGSIINIASIMGIVGVGQLPQASYNASKGGVVNLTREMAAQWARRGVRVNAICPGFFRSEMTTDMFNNDKSQKWMERKTPMGRAGDEHELDGALLFLASDASTYVTGHSLPVDGGWVAV